MVIKDPSVKKLLKRADSIMLDEYIASYPEDEIDGLSDLSIFIDELEYLIWMYEEDDTLQHEDLVMSKKILKDTHNGKTIPVVLPEFTIMYSAQDIADAKSTVNEYRRLKRLLTECLR